MLVKQFDIGYNEYHIHCCSHIAMFELRHPSSDIYCSFMSILVIYVHINMYRNLGQ